jgi:hypothetical protein
MNPSTYTMLEHAKMDHGRGVCKREGHHLVSIQCGEQHEDEEAKHHFRQSILSTYLCKKKVQKKSVLSFLAKSPSDF